MRRVFLVLLIAAIGSAVPPGGVFDTSPWRLSAAGGPPLVQRVPKPTARQELSREARREFIRRAQVWQPTDVAHMDLRAGPQGNGAFPPNALVTCDYINKEMRGGTEKFSCVLGDGEVVKVRYGPYNGEVQGSVLATRLLWALGFPADRVYPVRIRCRGCSADPWNDRRYSEGVREFDPAVIERNPQGRLMWENDEKWGWNWSEMDNVDEDRGGAPRAHRDALKLLVVFMQHADTKWEQQRLLCRTSQPSPNGECAKPFLLLHDVGLTFGHSNWLNKNYKASVNLEKWAQTPVWRNRKACEGDLDKPRTGTLENPRISEAGRKFLADLLVQLSDHQLRDLFEVAGVERRAEVDYWVSAGKASEWIAVFKEKRNEIVTARCPR